ncbi:MAG: hypothetical protein H0X38_09280 [Planctomycetes bacterium]|nr:hypothetical protein [Planctomycetota bacterium]
MTSSAPLIPRLCAFVLLVAGASAAQLTAADDSAIPQVGAENNTAAGSTKGLHSWELPALTIQGAPRSDLRDDDLVGSYGQPRWSTSRRFTEVRTYVIPAGQFDFEYWLFISQPTKREKDDAAAAGQPKPKAEVKQQYEAEMGLGYRFQLDLYQVYVKDGSNGDNALDATKFEIRWAFADWGRIWGNPTAYVEWEQAAHGADSAEVKLLLSDDITTRWAWATNLVAKRKTGDNRALSAEWNSAIAYSAIDQKLSIGAELALAQVSELEDAAGSHRIHHYEAAVGPSIRFTPIPQAHIIVSQLVGLNSNTSAAKTVAILGWEF